MAKLQCKICGNSVEVFEKALTVPHSCGAEIVLPSNLTEERIELFNTGYKFLRALDFQKAASIFNQILDMGENKDYEAHWCLALCDFKIEYRLNNVTKKIEMITHYSGNEVFTENKHYLFAVKNSRVAVRKVYNELAQRIDEAITAKKIANGKHHEAYNYLSQGNFDKAEPIFDEMLETSSYEPMAYIGKLLCELKYTDVDQLAESNIPLTHFKNYNNAILCADKDTKVFLNKYNVAVSERLNKQEELDEESKIHTLDEMELSAYDTFDITTADKIVRFFRNIVLRIFEFQIYISDHMDGFRALLISLCVIIILGVTGLVLSQTVFAPVDYYEVGTQQLESGNVVSAAENFAFVKNQPEAVKLMKSDKFLDEIRRLYNNGKVRDAIHLANLCGITTTGIDKLDMLINETVSAGENHSLAITSDKRVLASNTSHLIDYNECNVQSWTNIISVSAGTFHSVGLKSDGTVLATGDNRFGQCNVEGWKNIIAISAGGRHTVGLKSDGTVIATAYLGETNMGQANVTLWEDVIAVSAADDYTVGLLADGTVVSTKYIEGIEKWKNIIAVSANTNNVLALTADGKVLSAKDTATSSDFGQNNCSAWQDIIKISAGNQHSLGLQADGKLLSTKHTVGDVNKQTDIIAWDNVVDFSAGLDSSVALTEKHQFVATPKTDVRLWTYK